MNRGSSSHAIRACSSASASERHQHQFRPGGSGRPPGRPGSTPVHTTAASVRSTPNAKRPFASSCTRCVVSSGVVLLVLLSRGGWGNAVDLSPVAAQILVVLAAVAFVLTLLLVLVLGISV